LRSILVFSKVLGIINGRERWFQKNIADFFRPNRLGLRPETQIGFTEDSSELDLLRVEGRKRLTQAIAAMQEPFDNRQPARGH